jgi:hypothetical protein
MEEKKMTQKEIDEAIKRWDIEDEYYNFKTPKSTYATYCMICFFENRNLKVTRIINDKKCEVKVFKNGNSLSINYYHVRDYYNDNLEYKKNRIIDFEIV